MAISSSSGVSFSGRAGAVRAARKTRRQAASVPATRPKGRQTLNSRSTEEADFAAAIRASMQEQGKETKEGDNFSSSSGRRADSAAFQSASESGRTNRAGSEQLEIIAASTEVTSPVRDSATPVARAASQGFKLPETPRAGALKSTRRKKPLPLALASSSNNVSLQDLQAKLKKLESDKTNHKRTYLTRTQEEENKKKELTRGFTKEINETQKLIEQAETAAKIARAQKAAATRKTNRLKRVQEAGNAAMLPPNQALSQSSPFHRPGPNLSKVLSPPLSTTASELGGASSSLLQRRTSQLSGTQAEGMSSVRVPSILELSTQYNDINTKISQLSANPPSPGRQNMHQAVLVALKAEAEQLSRQITGHQ